MPSAGVLALHDLRKSYGGFGEFQPQLAGLLQQGGLLNDVVQVTHALGILEPFSGEHLPPEAIQIQGPNYRESLVANGLHSRNRAVLVVLEQIYGSLEALTGFALWLRRHLRAERLPCSEFLEEAEQSFTDIPHQDLCALRFADASVDLELAFREIARVLRPGGRLAATTPTLVRPNS
jgi:SAM-dependent methyltransferase